MIFINSRLKIFEVTEDIIGSRKFEFNDQNRIVLSEEQVMKDNSLKCDESFVSLFVLDLIETPIY